LSDAALGGERARIRVQGVVQGVGFRPFVYLLARRHRLAGWVLNDAQGVLIEAVGDPDALAGFTTGLRSEAPVASMSTPRASFNTHPASP